MMNSLSQTLLKITCPGVPDCYQGSELWDLRLVDPDNRGAIDYEMGRTALIHTDSNEAPERFLRCWQDARVKLHVAKSSLAARREHPDLFAKGRYLPLDASGPHADRLIAFAREYQGNWLISVCPRCIASVQAPITGADSRSEFWKDTILRLPKGAPSQWVNRLGGKCSSAIPANQDGASMGDIFRDFPIALLQAPMM